MVPDIVLNTGEFYFSREPVRIGTLLGSCVAFTAWHPTRRIGGMCHYLLPVGTPRDPDKPNAKGMYAEGAAELFEREFHLAGTHVSEYVIKMFGGGNMFPRQSSREHCDNHCEPEASSSSCRDVSCRNIIQGRHIFESRGFTIAIENVGGLGSRHLVFDVWSGDVWVRRSKSPPKLG
jgi:chemotaxis protein CheD